MWLFWNFLLPIALKHESRLGQKVTNHSVRSTAVHMLIRHGISENSIWAITRHATRRALEHYGVDQETVDYHRSLMGRKIRNGSVNDDLFQKNCITKNIYSTVHWEKI